MAANLSRADGDEIWKRVGSDGNLAAVFEGRRQSKRRNLYRSGLIVFRGSIKRLLVEEVVGLSLGSDCEAQKRLACALLPRDAAIDADMSLTLLGTIDLSSTTYSYTVMIVYYCRLNPPFGCRPFGCRFCTRLPWHCILGRLSNFRPRVLQIDMVRGSSYLISLNRGPVSHDCGIRNAGSQVLEYEVHTLYNLTT